MLARVIALAWAVALSATGIAIAQTDGPAEQPAADYQGQSYVDSRGCIFLKAGYGGAATWVPRVDQNRKPICGQTPTNAIEKVSSAAASEAQPTAKARIARRAARAEPARAPVKIGCPISVPVARRYATTDGGSVVICTATNGSLTGARSPIYPNGSGVGAALSAKRYPGVTIPLLQIDGAMANAPETISLPKGYEPAWKDDRLNPLRGKSVANGQIKPSDNAGQATAKTPALAGATSAGAYYVQVGTYGEPTNATGASARLKALGLPVSKGNFSRQGRQLQVIYAGPFGTGTDAQAALIAARGIGFSDAFIR